MQGSRAGGGGDAAFLGFSRGEQLGVSSNEILHILTLDVAVVLQQQLQLLLQCGISRRSGLEAEAAHRAIQSLGSAIWTPDSLFRHPVGNKVLSEKADALLCAVHSEQDVCTSANSALQCMVALHSRI